MSTAHGTSPVAIANGTANSTPPASTFARKQPQVPLQATQLIIGTTRAVPTDILHFPARVVVTPADAPESPSMS